MRHRFFYNLLTILPIVLVASFGLSLWQTGGTILQSDWQQTIDAISFSNFVQVANAQTACSEPTPASAGEGRIYYNPCLKTFRMSRGDAADGGAWQDLSGYWTISAQNQLYNINPASVVLSTVGAPAVTGAYPALGTPGRDVLILNVNAAAGDLAVLRLANVPKLGLYSDTLGSWGNLLVNQLTASEICLPDDSDPNNCKQSWSFAQGSSLWAYISDNKGTIYNVNLNDPDNYPETGGNVNITNTLTVERAVVIEAKRTGSTGYWTNDTASTTCDVGGNSNNPWTKDCICTIAACNETDLYLSKLSGTLPNANRPFFVSPGTVSNFKVVVGNGGFLASSTYSGSWQKLIAYSSDKRFTSVWASNNGYIYGIDATKIRGLSYTTTSGSGWIEAGCSTSDYFNTSQNSKLWGFYDVEQLNRFVLNVSPDYSNNISIFCPTCSNFKKCQYDSVGGPNLEDIVGNKQGYLYVLNRPLDHTKLQFIKSFKARVDANDDFKFDNKGDFYFSVGSSTGLQYNIDVRAIALDYENPITEGVDGLTSCANCMVLVGDRVNYYTGQPPTNILIGNGSNNSNSWWKVELIVKLPGGGETNYNSDGVSLYDVQVNQGRNIILAGIDNRAVPAHLKYFVLTSIDGGAHWSLSTPDINFSCTSGVNCDPYWVGIYGNTFYAANSYNRIYFLGSSEPAGSLTVAGDIIAEHNTWGGSVGGFGGHNSSASNGIIMNIGPESGVCPSGEYMVGLKVGDSNDGIYYPVQGIICQRL